MTEIVNTRAPWAGQYWCVKSTLSSSGEFYVWADEVRVTDTGALVVSRKDGTVGLILASGNWECIYAASLEDGSAIAAEHWPGEAEDVED
jgi:hypothetical protein